MKVEALLPDEISGFAYVKNHHYVKLTDRFGNVAQMPATGLLKLSCPACDLILYLASHVGHCRCIACGAVMTPLWGRLQVCFVPEKESDFQAPPQMLDGLSVSPTPGPLEPIDPNALLADE